MAVCGLVALLSAPARADGPGLKFGDARLHPYLELESWFDSAAATVGVETNRYEIVGDLVFHIRPGFKLEVPSSPVALTWVGYFDWAQPAGVINPDTTNARHWGLDSDLDVAFNREGQVVLDVGDHVVRSDQNTSTPSLYYGTLSLLNEARVRLSFRPYNGALTIEPGYRFGVEVFSPLSSIDTCTSGSDPNGCQLASLSMFDYMDHTVTLNARWKFFPKTALTFDSAFGAREYINPGSTNIMTFTAAVGAAGLLTTHWSVLLRVGWGQDLTMQSYSSVIGQAEVAYLFSETASVRLGYVRTFAPTGGTYLSFGDDRGYLDGRVLLGGKLTAHGAVAFDYISLRGPEIEMDQYKTSLDLGVDYELKEWLTIGGGYRFSYITSSNGLVYSGLDSFTRHEVFLRLQLVY